MRSVGVVVDPPCFDDLTRLVEVVEQVLVESTCADRTHRQDEEMKEAAN